MGPFVTITFILPMVSKRLPNGSMHKECDHNAGVQETQFQSLGWEDSLEKGKATHSSILTWRIPWTVVHGVAKSRTQLSDFH